MQLCEILKKDRFIITAELGPPKGTNMQNFFKQADYLKGVVSAVNVTEQQSALMKMGSIAACHLLKDYGIEPIMQATCRDKNRIALQSDILSASALGIHNALILTGDPVRIGDHPDAKPVFDLEAADLMAIIRKMSGGMDMTDHPLDGAPTMCIGAALNPCVDDIETEISKTRKKISCGAQFFQTQGIFEIARFKRFMERYHSEGFKIPVLAGVILLKSVKMATFMNGKIPGIFIPNEMIARFENCAEPKKVSVSTSVQIIKAAQPYCQGAHLMAIGWEELIPEVVQSIL